jgi:hypothetical protein
MNVPLSIERQVNFRRRLHGRREIVAGAPATVVATEPGRVPRVSRLAALALRFEHLVRCGEINNFSEIAAVGHVTRARISQIINLLNLAPDILEAILHLPRTQGRRDPIHLRQLQRMAMTFDWDKQRRQWRDLCRQQGVTEQI